MINQVSAILLVSNNPAELAEFYGRAFGLKFAREEHDDMEVHFGAYLGSVHLGIHPPSNFPEGPATGDGGLKLAFDTLDFDALLDHLAKEEIPLLYPPRKNQWSKMTAVRDPDGNFIELLQPCNEILQAASTRGGATNKRVAQYVEDGGGFTYK